MHKNISRCACACPYIRTSRKIRKMEFSCIFELWPPFFAFTKEFLKNTKENMPPDHFCSHLRQDGQIDLPSSPDCHIFSAVYENTHQPTFNAIMAIWLTGHMAIMASKMAIMGGFGNTNKNGPAAYFPLYF